MQDFPIKHASVLDKKIIKNEDDINDNLQFTITGSLNVHINGKSRKLKTTNCQAA